MPKVIVEAEPASPSGDVLKAVVNGVNVYFPAGTTQEEFNHLFNCCHLVLVKKGQKVPMVPASQLPPGMEHCTIEFKECEHGHGRLMAKNWYDSGCQTCEIRDLQDRLKAIKQFML